jgi:hypothetical protein
MIYAYLYLIDDIPSYAGKGKDARCLNHISSKNGKFAVQLKSFIAAGCNITVKIFPVVNEEDAYLKEKCLIQLYGRRDLETGTLFNLTDGGGRGWGSNTRFSAEHRRKLSAARQARNMSAEALAAMSAKISAIHKGVKRSTETKARMSAAQKGIPKPISEAGKLHLSMVMTGVKKTPQAIANSVAARQRNKQARLAQLIH